MSSSIGHSSSGTAWFSSAHLRAPASRRCSPRTSAAGATSWLGCRVEDSDADPARFWSYLVMERCLDPGIVGRALARIEARHGVAERSARPIGLVEDLTDRELAVLRYLPSKLSQREIAGELYVSTRSRPTARRSTASSVSKPARPLCRPPATTASSDRRLSASPVVTDEMSVVKLGRSLGVNRAGLRSRSRPGR